MSTPDNTRPAHGLILFGHGARDPRWAEPFERLLTLVRAGAAPVTLAYLELMTPGLADAVASQVAAGCDRITVVPVFFGRGAHLRRDLPKLIEACRAAHDGVDIRLATAVGEDDLVLHAIAAFCLRARDT